MLQQVNVDLAELAKAHRTAGYARLDPAVRKRGRPLRRFRQDVLDRAAEWGLVVQA